MRSVILVAGAVAAMGFSGPGEAASRVPAAIQALTDCRALADSAARLACYDKAAAGIADATAKKDIVVLDREEVRATRRGLFGFTLPRLPFFGGDKGDKSSTDAAREEVEEIDTTVTAVRGFGYKYYRMTMEDGAVWVTTEAVEHDTPHPGSKVHIKRAALGSYFLRIDGGRALKGKREG
jgi:hypothetical protein